MIVFNPSNNMLKGNTAQIAQDPTGRQGALTQDEFWANQYNQSLGNRYSWDGGGYTPNNTTQSEKTYDGYEGSTGSAWEINQNDVDRQNQVTWERELQAMEMQNRYNVNSIQKAADLQAAENRVQREWQAEQNRIAMDFSMTEAEKNRAYQTAERQAAEAYQTASQEIAMKYNSAETQKNRDWEEYMSGTSYQRAVKDLAKAGINPIYAAHQGGASSPPGSTASVAAMSSRPGSGAQGQGYAGGSGGGQVGHVAQTSKASGQQNTYYLQNAMAQGIMQGMTAGVGGLSNLIGGVLGLPKEVGKIGF